MGLGNRARTAVCALAVAVALLGPGEGDGVACTMRTRPKNAAEIVYEASSIVRARAIDYVAPPDAANHGWGSVRFEVLEVIKGTFPEATIALPGQLERYDGANDRPVPYDRVRLGGLHGDCGAHDYQRGTEFVLLLKPWSGGWTANWAALAATNEQSSAEWVAWIKEALSDPAKLEAAAQAGAQARKEELERWESRGQADESRPPNKARPSKK